MIFQWSAIDHVTVTQWANNQEIVAKQRSRRLVKPLSLERHLSRQDSCIKPSNLMIVNLKRRAAAQDMLLLHVLKKRGIQGNTILSSLSL